MGYIRTVLDHIHAALKGSVGRIKLNAVTFASMEGRAVVIKRRNIFGRHITRVANVFFRVVGAPVAFDGDMESWRRSEVACFNALHRRYRAQTLGADAICQDRLPGESLWDHLQHGTLTPAMLIAAGRELRRAHGFMGDDGPWTHGDAAMRNFLYDPAARCARLIDFELRHDARLPAERRQAEDMLSFLLDLASLTPARRWLPEAHLFLDAYGPSAAIAALREKLQVPTGLARLWWGVRVNFAGNGRMARYLGRLRRSLDRERRHASAASTTQTLPPIARPQRRARQMPARAPA